MILSGIPVEVIDIYIRIPKAPSACSRLDYTSKKFVGIPNGFLTLVNLTKTSPC